MSDNDDGKIVSLSKKRLELSDVLDDLYDAQSISQIDESLFQEDIRLDDMNKKHAFIQSVYGKPMVLCNIYDPMTDSYKEDFRDPNSIMMQYCNQTAMAGDKVMELGRWWVKHPKRREYETVIFDPNLPKEYRSCYNMWQGMAVTPKRGSWRHTRKHIWKILCNKDKLKFKYFIKWLAWMIQNPGKPAEVAVVIKGKQGAGKGFVFNQFVTIFGQHGMAISNAKHLSGNFNIHLARTVFLFSDEAYNAGDKQAEAVLKQIITESKITVEGKFKDASTMRNCLHIAMASNDDWVLPVAHDSRRFFINQTDNSYAKNECDDDVREKYFKRLFNEMEKGGRRAMLHDLMMVQLGDWHPRNSVPNTEEVEHQKMLSLNKAEKLMYYFLDEGIFPGIVTDLGEYLVKREVFREFMEKIYPQAKQVSNTALAGIFVKMGVTKVHKTNGNFFQFPKLKILRRVFQEDIHNAEFKAPEDWRILGGTTNF